MVRQGQRLIFLSESDLVQIFEGDQASGGGSGPAVLPLKQAA